MGKKREVPENVINYVKEEIESLDYGSVSIEVIGDNKKIDIVTKRRKRFENGVENKEKQKNKGNLIKKYNKD